MSSDPAATIEDPAALTLEELVAVQPRHLRGALERGMRGPDGERPGRGRAATLDFDALGPYQPGDDVRAIDWRASLRADETVVRRFSAASHRARMIAADLRPDLFFGTETRVMAKTLCLVAARLAWSAQMLNEPVGLLAGGETHAPRRGRRHVLRLLDRLTAGFEAARGGATAPVDIETAAALIGRGDELCLITDPPPDPAPLIRAGRALSGARVLRLALVEDRFTTAPPRRGRYPVKGEDGARRVIHVGGAAARPDANLRALEDAGWRIERALDLLPRAAPQ